MRKSRLQNYLLASVFLYVLLAVAWSFRPSEPEIAEMPVLISPKAEIGGGEDLQSRDEYEFQMLANPKTGEIPSDIRTKELKFAATQQRQLLTAQPLAANEANQQTANQNLNWSQVGPSNFGGRTRAVGMDIRDESLLLAGGVSGGVWRSVNQGESWVRASTTEEIQSVTAIAQNVNAGQEDIWYYGTGEIRGNSPSAPGAFFHGDGIFKSVDNGITWQPLVSTQSNSLGMFISPFQFVSDITTNPNSPDDEVIAAVFGGIVRSTDGGQTWATVLGDDLLSSPRDQDLNDASAIFYTDIHRTSAGLLVASLSSVTINNSVLSPLAGVYTSTDGVTWTPILNLSGTSVRRIEIGSSPSSPDIIYVVVDEISGHGLWRINLTTHQSIRLSTNIPDGRGNSLGAYDSQRSFNMLVSVHPTDPDIVFLGGTNLYRSTNGFSTNTEVSWIGGYDPESTGVAIYPNHHPDQHGVLFVPSNPDKMLSFNDGGIFVTEDNRADSVGYTPLNNGYVTTQFFTGVFSKYPPDDFVIGGAQDNGSIVTTNTLFTTGENGSRVFGGDGAFVATTPIGVFYYLSAQNSRIFRVTLNSDFERTSFARVDPTGAGTNPSQPYLFINPYVLDPNNANRMYLAGGDFLWRNRNLSQILTGSQSTTSTNWTRLDKTELAEGQISAVQVSTTPRDIVYHGTSDGRVFKIIDANTELYQVEEITSTLFPADGFIRSIAIDPVNADEILVSFSNYGIPSIFRSVDGGDTFEDVSGTLEENPSGEGNGPSVRWVNIVPQTDGTKLYYAATSTGLYATTTMNGQSTIWSIESGEGIGNSVVNMVDYRRSDGKVVAATHGRGMFTAQISDVIPAEVVDGSADFELNAVFPNPFSDLITFNLNLPETNLLLIRIYDSAGNQIRTVSGGLGFIGENDFFWDGTNTLGNPVQDGIYLVRITYKNQSTVRRIQLRRQ